MLCGTGLNRRSVPVRIGFGKYSGAVCLKILGIGSMPFFIIVLDNLLSILLNAMLRKYGGSLGDQYISYAAPEVFVRLFLSDPGAFFARRYCIGFVFVAIQFAFVDGFNAMGMVREAIPISFFRKSLYVIAVLVLPRFLPLEYIFYACPISDCVGFIFTLAMYFLILKKRLAVVMMHRSKSEQPES